MAGFEVTGPLAVVKDGTGKLRYYYTGAVLPEDLPAEEVSRLVAVGLVSEVKPLPVGLEAEKPARRPAVAKD